MSSLRHTFLGAFLFGSLALLGVVTIYLGNFAFQAGEHSYVFFFDDVDGLKAGNPVTVYGVEMGRVEEIAFTGSNEEEERLAVTVFMDQPLNLLEGARVRIGSQSLLGGKRIEIETGPPTAARLDTRTLRGELTGGIDRIIGDLVTDNRDDVQRILSSVGDLVESVASGRASLMTYLLDESSRTDLATSLARIRTVTENLTEGDGTLAMLLRDPAAYRDLVSLIDRGRVLLNEAVEGDGNLALFLREDDLYMNAREVMNTAAEFARRAREGEGAIGRAFAPESAKLVEDVEVVAANLRSLSENLTSGKGVVGLLLNDPEARARIERIAANLDTVAEGLALSVDDLRAGKGALGYLIADEDAARTLRRLLALTVGAVEDAREAAPVSSFASFLFGQF